MICFNPRRLIDPRDPGPSEFRDVRKVAYIEVRCGKCAGCRVSRADEWADRMYWESAYYEDTSFITLTYRDEDLPFDLSVCKRAFQLFMKRFRKSIRREVKYFACGEYGERHGRPHYHMVAFGVGVSELKSLRAAWPFGDVNLQPFVRGRARYVAGYLLKEVDGSVDMSGRVPPFGLMSKNIGLRFAEANAERCREGRLTINGKPVGVPRYFRKVLGIVGESDPDWRAEVFDVHAARVGSLDVAAVERSVEASRREAELDFLGRMQARWKEDNGL